MEDEERQRKLQAGKAKVIFTSSLPVCCCLPQNVSPAWLRFTSACCCLSLPQNLPPIWDSTHCCHYLTNIWDSHLPHVYLSFTSILSFTSKNDWHLWFHSHLAYINSHLPQFYLTFTSENNWLLFNIYLYFTSLLSFTSDNHLHLCFNMNLPHIYFFFTSLL